MARSKKRTPKVEELRPYVEGVAKNLVEKVYGSQGPAWGTKLTEIEDVLLEIREVLAENEGYAMREAQTQAERDLLWAGRKGAIGALGRIKPNYYLHDGVVPRSRLPLRKAPYS